MDGGGVDRVVTNLFPTFLLLRYKQILTPNLIFLILYCIGLEEIARCDFILK